MVELDNLIMKLGQESEQLEPREGEEVPMAWWNVTSMGPNLATEEELRGYQTNQHQEGQKSPTPYRQYSWASDGRRQCPTTGEDMEMGYSTATKGPGKGLKVGSLNKSEGTMDEENLEQADDVGNVVNGHAYKATYNAIKGFLAREIELHKVWEVEVEGQGIPAME